MSVTESQKRLAHIKDQPQEIKNKLMLNFNSSSFWRYFKLITNVAVV